MRYTLLLRLVDNAVTLLQELRPAHGMLQQLAESSTNLRLQQTAAQAMQRLS